jgi:hypothetical protein
MRHDMESCDQGGEDQDEAQLWILISHRTMRCWSTQQGLAWWQPSEPWEKITVSTLSTLQGGLPSCNTSLYLLSYILVLV